MNVAEVKWRCDLQKWGREGQVGSIHAELGIICSTNIGWEAACLAALLQKKSSAERKADISQGCTRRIAPYKTCGGIWSCSSASVMSWLEDSATQDTAIQWVSYLVKVQGRA